MMRRGTRHPAEARHCGCAKSACSRPPEDFSPVHPAMIATNRPPGKSRAAYSRKKLSPGRRAACDVVTSTRATDKRGGAEWAGMGHRPAVSRTNLGSLTIELPVPAREEPQEREHQNHDEDDPEDAHAFGASLLSARRSPAVCSAGVQRKTQRWRYGLGQHQRHPGVAGAVVTRYADRVIPMGHLRPGRRTLGRRRLRGHTSQNGRRRERRERRRAREGGNGAGVRGGGGLPGDVA